MNTSRRCSEPLAETVVPDSTRDTSRPVLRPAHDDGAAAEVDDEFVFAPRRILHAAIRIGKSFELVVECCVL